MIKTTIILLLITPWCLIEKHIVTQKHIRNLCKSSFSNFSFYSLNYRSEKVEFPKLVKTLRYSQLSLQIYGAYAIWGHVPEFLLGYVGDPEIRVIMCHGFAAHVKIFERE
jgi:hypothetical protein